jgi:hypothetical protein
VVIGAIVLSVCALSARAAVARVEASRDNTLIEHPAGALSNGSGPAFYVGRTNQPSNSLRRGVLRFDLEGVLPDGAVVDAVKLIAHVTATNGPNEIRLVRLGEDWGEGASSTSGGQGVPAQPGDATWIHAFFDRELWGTPGATAPLVRASARAVTLDVGPIVWSGPGLRRDVEGWLGAPERNFGWILIGDELTSQTVSRLESRESPAVELRPVLEITYHAGRHVRR